MISRLILYGFMMYYVVFKTKHWELEKFLGRILVFLYPTSQNTVISQLKCYRQRIHLVLDGI